MVLLKRKVVLKSKLPSDSSSQKTNSTTIQTPLFTAYSNEWRLNSDIRNCFSFLRKWYEDLFNEFPPEQPLELIHTRIQYELLIRDYLNAKIPIPKAIKNNYEASREFDIEKLTPNLRKLLKANLKTGGEERMAKEKKAVKAEVKKDTVAKAAAVKKPRISVDETYYNFLSVNHTKKLTDDQIAAEMRKLFPNKKPYQAKDVKAARTAYNGGRLSKEQKGKPSEVSVAYGEERAGKAIPVNPKKETATLNKKVVLKKKG